jgi:hypothetical protein
MRQLPLLILFTVTVLVTSPLAQYRTGDPSARVAQKTLEKSVETRLADRRGKCMSAIGSPAFCDCLNGALPLEADFQRYITVTTSSTSGQLSPDDKKIASIILATRDECVARVFSSQK